MSEVVKLTEVATEMEAAMLCGYLESHGIRATHDQGGIQQSRRFIRAEAMGGTAYSGRQEILVLAVDLERAQELLEEANA